MNLRGWHISREGESLTISRGPVARFDVWAEAGFPACDAFRLALQIRQDLWRVLQGVRGFRPVVCTTTCQHGLTVRAGGELTKNQPNMRHVSDKIVDLLSDPDNRRRWVIWASKGNRQGMRP